MIFGGVDPGRWGAISFLTESGQAVEVIPLPMIAGGPDFDFAAIAAIFRNRADPRLKDRGLFVTVEKLDAMPMKFAKKGGRKGDDDAGVSGVIANHRRGMTWSLIGMLAAFRIPYAHVRPQKWQRVMTEGYPGKDTKAISIEIAKKLWPRVSLRRTALARTDSSDLAESLLIAEYGRRQALGGAIFAGASR